MAEKQTKTAPSSMRYGGTAPSWSSQSLKLCPLYNSRAQRQSTSGCSPGFAINSKSTNQICLNRRSSAFTGSPLLEQRMFRAVDQPAFVAEGEPEDFSRLEIRPDRIGKSIVGCGIDLVRGVLPIRIDAHPPLFAIEHGNFLGPHPFVITLAADWNDAHAAAGRYDHVKPVLNAVDADALERRLHVDIHGIKLLFHPLLVLHQQHLRMEIRMRSEELVLHRVLSHRDRHDASRARALHAGKIAAKLVEFGFVLIKHLVGHRPDRLLLIGRS